MLKQLGAGALNLWDELLYSLGFFYRSLKATVHYIRRGTLGKRVITMQLLFTGVEAIGVTGLLAVSLGAVIIIQGVSILPQFGQGQLIYTILITVITRELGPVLCAFIVIARSATAIAAELGHMVVSHQIEAYTATGVDPIRYLVAPRYIGVTISLVLLNIYFNLFGLVGSYVLTQFFASLPAAEYFTNLLQQVRTVDVASSLLKSVVFGVIIAHAAAYNGLRVQQSSTEVPQVVIRAVVQSITLVIVADAVITMIYYL